MNLNQFLSRFKGESYFYGNASHAFYDVMVWLQKNKPKKNPNIIMPVYIPAKLYRFVLAAGYEPRFYDVSTDLDFNLSEIKGLIDDDTQAVFAVHFFGVPVDMTPLKKLTEQHQIFLIEDCAHIMNSSHHGKLLGSTGDFTLFSTRKMLLLHCGGVLVLNKKPWDFKPSYKKRVSSAFTAYHLIGSRVKFAVQNLLKGQKLRDISLDAYDGYIDRSETHKVNVKQMDYFSILHGHFTDLNIMKDVRRKNIQYLLNGIKDFKQFHPIGIERYAEKDALGKYSLKPGFVPFSMPVLTLQGTREQIRKELAEANILSFAGWPEVPFGLSGFEGAERLSEQLLELPVHKFIDQNQLIRMVECLNNFSDHSAKKRSAPKTPAIE